MKTISFIIIIICASVVFIVISKNERRDIESHKEKEDDFEKEN